MTYDDLSTLAWSEVPKITSAQMRQLIILATGRYGFDMGALVEKAGASFAALAERLVPDGPALVVVGRGYNGGTGLAAACSLAARGRRLWVVPTHEAENYSGVPKEQLERLSAYNNVRLKSSLPKMKFSCVLDAAVGTGLEGPPRGRTLDVISVVNKMGSPIVSLDVPSGVCADDGHTPGDVVHATATLALALPKEGAAPGGHIGELFVTSLDLPDDLYGELGLDPFHAPKPWARIV